MNWVYLILAGCFEVVGVTAMNNAIKHKNVQSYLALIIGFICIIIVARGKSKHHCKSDKKYK